jgi:hypothetical protein
MVGQIVGGLPRSWTGRHVDWNIPSFGTTIVLATLRDRREVGVWKDFSG